MVIWNKISLYTIFSYSPQFYIKLIIKMRFWFFILLTFPMHAIDFSADIYGKNLTVEFLTFIRDEKKFENLNELSKQIKKDIQIVKDYHLNN